MWDEYWRDRVLRAAEHRKGEKQKRGRGKENCSSFAYRIMEGGILWWAVSLVISHARTHTLDSPQSSNLFNLMIDEFINLFLFFKMLSCNIKIENSQPSNFQGSFHKNSQAIISVNPSSDVHIISLLVLHRKLCRWFLVWMCMLS